MFSHVCVCSRGGGTHPFGVSIPEEGWVLNPPSAARHVGYGQQAGVTHLTEMLSCLMCSKRVGICGISENLFIGGVGKDMSKNQSYAESFETHFCLKIYKILIIFQPKLWQLFWSHFFEMDHRFLMQKYWACWIESVKTCLWEGTSEAKNQHYSESRRTHFCTKNFEIQRNFCSQSQLWQLLWSTLLWETWAYWVDSNKNTLGGSPCFATNIHVDPYFK